MNQVPVEIWVMVILAIAAAVGTLLVFILNGIKHNQERIWRWAEEAVKDLKQEIAVDHERMHTEIMDLRRSTRHSLRTMYTEIIELARHCPGGEDVIKSIHKTLSKGD